MRTRLGGLNTKAKKAAPEMGASEMRRRLDCPSRKDEKAGGQHGTNFVKFFQMNPDGLPEITFEFPGVAFVTQLLIVKTLLDPPEMGSAIPGQTPQTVRMLSR